MTQIKESIGSWGEPLCVTHHASQHSLVFSFYTELKHVACVLDILDYKICLIVWKWTCFGNFYFTEKKMRYIIFTAWQETVWKEVHLKVLMHNMSWQGHRAWGMDLLYKYSWASYTNPMNDSITPSSRFLFSPMCFMALIGLYIGF